MVMAQQSSSRHKGHGKVAVKLPANYAMPVSFRVFCFLHKRSKPHQKCWKDSTTAILDADLEGRSDGWGGVSGQCALRGAALIADQLRPGKTW